MQQLRRMGIQAPNGGRKVLAMSEPKWQEITDLRLHELLQRQPQPVAPYLFAAYKDGAEHLLKWLIRSGCIQASRTDKALQELNIIIDTAYNQANYRADNWARIDDEQI